METHPSSGSSTEENKNSSIYDTNPCKRLNSFYRNQDGKFSIKKLSVTGIAGFVLLGLACLIFGSDPIDEAVEELVRYEIIDKYADVELKKGKEWNTIRMKYRSTLYIDDSKRKAAEEFLYHYMLYKDGKEELSDYDYVNVIYDLWWTDTKKHLPLDAVMAFLEGGGAHKGNIIHLHGAIHAGHEEAVEKLIEIGVDVNRRIGVSLFHKGTTPLQRAIQCGNTQCMEMLIAAGAVITAHDIETVVSNADTEKLELLLKKGAKAVQPYHVEMAMEKRYTKGVEVLLDADTEINCSGAIAIAARMGDHQCARLMLEKDKNIDCTSALSEAAKRSDSKCITMLLDADADANCTGALSDAARAGSPECVKLLIKGGADLHAGSLAAAVVGGNSECFELLLKAGANVNTGNPLKLAVQAGRTDFVEQLVNAGADSSHGELLYIAAKDGKTDIAKILIEAGVDVRYVFQKEPGPYHGMNVSALAIALETNHVDIAEMIAKSGRDNSVSSISWAVKHNKLEICKNLLKAGADVNAFYEPDHSHQLLSAATNNNYRDIVEVLLKAGANPSIECDRYQDRGPVLKLAMKKDLFDIAILLVQHGALLYLDSMGYLCDFSIPQWAIKKNHLELFTEIMKAKSRDEKIKNSCWHDAVLRPLLENGKYEFIKAYNATENNTVGFCCIQEAGMMENTHNLTPMGCALRFGGEGSVEAVKAMLQQGTSPNCMVALPITDEGFRHFFRWNKGHGSVITGEKEAPEHPLLHVAAVKCSAEMVRMLLEAGANPCIGEEWGEYSPDKASKSTVPFIVYPHDIARTQEIRDILLEAYKKNGGKIQSR